MTPSLSHQLWRFHWDGEIQQAGFNPYQYSPRDGLFNPIRTTADQNVPAPAVAAFHPPLAELLFRWGYGWFEGLRSMKVLFTLFDLALIWLLARMLKARQLPPEHVLIYAWSPLAVFEIAGNGHMEAAAAFFALLALHWAGRRQRPAAAAVAAAFMTQWYALTLIPAVLAARRTDPIQHRTLSSAAWLIAVAVVVTLPFIWVDKHLALGAIVHNVSRHAASAATFNASLFAIVQSWFGLHAAMAMAIAVVVAVIAAALLRRRELDPLRAGFLILGALLLVMPQVYPWFMLWLLPLVVIWPEPAWLYFSVGVWLAYALPGHPRLIWLEYVPLFALLAWQVRRRPARNRLPLA